MSVVALIPARGGSKRIPRKNVRTFAGLPMIGYPIRAAMESGVFDHIVVSTEDEDIARIAEACGAEVPFRRPTELAGDFSTTEDVIRHYLRWEARFTPCMLCCIYPATPFLTPATLVRGKTLLEEHPDARSVVTVTPYPHPVQRALVLEEKGMLRWLFPEHSLQRTQDERLVYHDAGQAYWMRVSSSSDGAEEPLLFRAALPLPLGVYETVDLDTPEDWAFAEELYCLRNRFSGLES